MPIQVKPVRVFTREQPCTKVELYNTFRQKSGFVRRAWVEARGEIGLNAPKYLKKNSYAIAVTDKGIDYLVLTTAGQDWLIKGLKRHLELHPEDADAVQFPITDKSKAVRRVRG